MWKQLTEIIADKMYEHSVDCNLMPDEQKGIRHACRDAKKQLLIDIIVLEDCRKEKKSCDGLD